ncbi:hypothetical protein LMG27952_03120 [Paraburkholderia hiiakae]|uniref:Bacterial toxin YdaT domain-containing protein n=1 Tax=Paraburkholderia hiiakae TaxID=1081782 RepID=A0ABN7HTC1_9BURK|nr:hypothetical protein [Paraburkholderia hiiakae]CAD6536218.1 hypothetical protein LMG27952_03120 [Paraburkholderia hiiakae]
MRTLSHRSPIAAAKATVTDLKNARGWSRETVVEEIVEAHVRIGAERRINVRFSDHHDIVTRQKTNADRVYRWLEDDEKDSNLLSVNMLPSLLAALPVDMRIALANEILSAAGLSARVVESNADDDVNAQEIVRSIVRVNHRTEAAAADLLDGIDPGELPRLRNSLVDEISVKRDLVVRVEAAMCKTGEASPATQTKES